MSILQKLHDSEINASIESFWDGQWTAKLGDEMNGWDATNADLHSFAEAEAWLDAEARRRYPRSLYATGEYPAGWTGMGGFYTQRDGLVHEDPSLREPDVAQLSSPSTGSIGMGLGTILIVLLVLALLGVLPLGAGYNAGWGYGPGGIVGAILVIVVILALLGRI